MKISGKTIAVTGAGSGMGRELTLQLVNMGAKVAMIDINEPGMKETASLSEKSNLSIHVANIADRETVEALPDSIIQQHNCIDAIINNAGIIQPFVNINELEYDKNVSSALA